MRLRDGLILLAASAIFTASCGGSHCLAPRAQLVVNVSSATCQSCFKIAVIAQSPQITAAIQAGASPCATQVSGGPTGCVIGTVFVSSYGACGTAPCGPFTSDLSNDFAPSLAGAAPSITDTVALCAFNDDGNGHFTALGTCISSFNQCDASTTVTMNI